MASSTLGDDFYPSYRPWPYIAIDLTLKIVTRLAWGNISNPIICVGASRSYPFLFVSHYALLVSFITAKFQQNGTLIEA